MDVAKTWVGMAIGLCWVFTAVSWMLAVKHRREGVQLSKLMVNGMAAFDDTNFTERGKVHQQRFMLGFAGFFLLVVALMATIAVGGAMQPRPPATDAASATDADANPGPTD